MEGLVAADGGRSLKAGLLAFGALIWAAPVVAQSQDPLAPLLTATPPTGGQPGITVKPTQSGPSAALPSQGSGPPPISVVGQAPTQAPITITSPPQTAIAAPKDWRGVFDAIDAGNWSAARAGIATLPRSVLTAVAKAELYTAKGSPIVDLA
jgi:hypothetical protein